MRIPFEYIGALQQENKILKKEVADFKSGERFKQIQREHQKLIDEYRRQIKQLNLVIEGLHRDVKNAWKWCEEAYEDALKELHASMKELKCVLKEKEKKWLLSEREREQALSKITDLCHENSELKTQLDDEKGRNKKLLAQLNRDYENSSIPSSQSRNRSKIPNNRECTGRKPGAQLCLPTMEERNRCQLRSFAFRNQKRCQKIRVLRRQVRLLPSSLFLLS